MATKRATRTKIAGGFGSAVKSSASKAGPHLKPTKAKPTKAKSTKAKSKKAKPTKAKPTKAEPKKNRRKVAATRKRVPARPRLTADEIDRRLELARGSAGKRRLDGRGLQQRLAAALEVAQMIAMEIGYQSVLKLAFPPIVNESKWRSPWTIIGRFVWRGKKVGYSQLWEIFDRWELRRLESRINKDRISRIRVNYVTDRGKKEEYTMAETGPWQLALRRAKDECDPSDTETSHPGGATGSLASRYPESTIESIYVWLSESVGVNVMKMI